jgi:hypothetical protein
MKKKKKKIIFFKKKTNKKNKKKKEKKRKREVPDPPIWGSLATPMKVARGPRGGPVTPRKFHTHFYVRGYRGIQKVRAFEHGTLYACAPSKRWDRTGSHTLSINSPPYETFRIRSEQLPVCFWRASQRKMQFMVDVRYAFPPLVNLALWVLIYPKQSFGL